MSDIKEHLSEIVTVVIALSGAFWGLVKSKNSDQEKATDKRFCTLEKRVQVLSDLLEKMREGLVSADEIRKISMSVTALIETMTDIRLETAKKAEVLAVSDLLQKTREEILRYQTQDDTDDKHVDEVIKSLKNKLDLCIDQRTCEFIRSGYKEKNCSTAVREYD